MGFKIYVSKVVGHANQAYNTIVTSSPTGTQVSHQLGDFAKHMKIGPT